LNQQHWIDFAKADGRKNLPHLFVANVKDIMSDNTPVQTKIIGIARELRFMEITKTDESLPWDAKDIVDKESWTVEEILMREGRCTFV
jgi:hypothetical protein